MASQQGQEIYTALLSVHEDVKQTAFYRPYHVLEPKNSNGQSSSVIDAIENRCLMI